MIKKTAPYPGSILKVKFIITIPIGLMRKYFLDQSLKPALCSRPNLDINKNIWKLRGVETMAKKTVTRPAGVPEENVYNGMHWTLYIAMIAVIATLYVMVNAG